MKKMNLKIKLTSFVNFIVFFLFLYGFKLNFIPVNSSKLSVLLLVSFTFVLISTGLHNRLILKRSVFFSAALVLSLFLISFLYPVFHKTYDFNVPYFYFIMLSEALFGAYLLWFVFFRRKTEKEFLDNLLIVLVFQSIIIAMMLFFPAFRDLIFSVTPSENLEDMNDRYGGFRGLGLSGSVTYDLAIVQSFGLIVISYLSVRYRVSSLYYVLAWLLLLLSVLVSGRTGWIGVFFSLSFFILFLNRKSVVTTISRLFFIALLLLSALYMYIYFFQYWIIEFFTLTIAPYAFELFINIFQGDGATTKSTEKLESMYFWVGENTFFWGDGFWEKSDGEGYYGETDAGIMRHLLFYGIIPSALLIFVYSYFFYSILDYSKSIVFRYFVFVVFAYVMLAHLKGNFLIGSPMGIKFIMLMLVFYVHNKIPHRNCLVPSYQDSRFSEGN